MKNFNEYSITKSEYKQLNQYVENIYNITTVIDYFCSNQPEIEELCNLSPIIKNLRQNADFLNAFFINFDKNN